MAKFAIVYWKDRDPVIYGEWNLFMIVAHRLLELYVELSLTSTVNQVSTRKAISSERSCVMLDNTRTTDENLPHDIDNLVEKKDGTMIALDEVLTPGVKNAPIRTIKMRKVNPKYEVSKEYPYIDNHDYLNQLYGGKMKNRKSLLEHGFEWIEGAVKCLLCNVRLRQARSMEKTYTH